MTQIYIIILYYYGSRVYIGIIIIIPQLLSPVSDDFCHRIRFAATAASADTEII